MADLARLEVVVDPTGSQQGATKVVSELGKISKAARQMQTDVNKALDAMKASLRNLNLTVKMNVDTKAATSAVNNFIQSNAKKNITVGIKADMTKAKATLNELAKKEFMAKVSVKADTSQVLEKMKELQAKDFKVDVDARLVTTPLLEKMKELQAKDFKVDVDAILKTNMFLDKMRDIRNREYLVDITAVLDVEKAREQMRTFTSKERKLNVDVVLKIEDEKRKLSAFIAMERIIKIIVKPQISNATAALETLVNKERIVMIKVQADTTDARKRISAIDDNIEPLKLPVSLRIQDILDDFNRIKNLQRPVEVMVMGNITDFQNKMTAILNEKRSIEIPIKGNKRSITASLQNLLNNQQREITIPIKANVSSANTSIQNLLSKVREVFIVVKARTASAIQSIEALTKKEYVVTVKVNAQTEKAMSELNAFATMKREIIIPIKCDKRSATTSINNLINQERMITIMIKGDAASFNGTIGNIIKKERIVQIKVDAMTESAQNELNALVNKERIATIAIKGNAASFNGTIGNIFKNERMVEIIIKGNANSFNGTIGNIVRKQREVEIKVGANVDAVIQQLNAFTTQERRINIFVELNFGDNKAELQNFVTMARKIVIQVDTVLQDEISKINAFVNQARVIKILVEVDLIAAKSTLETFAAMRRVIPMTVSIDFSGARTQMDTFVAATRAINIRVRADLAAVETALNGLINNVPPIQVRFSVNIREAQSLVEAFMTRPRGIVFIASVDVVKVESDIKNYQRIQRGILFTGFISFIDANASISRFINEKRMITITARLSDENLEARVQEFANKKLTKTISIRIPIADAEKKLLAFMDVKRQLQIDVGLNMKPANDKIRAFKARQKDTGITITGRLDLSQATSALNAFIGTKRFFSVTADAKFEVANGEIKSFLNLKRNLILTPVIDETTAITKINKFAATERKVTLMLTTSQTMARKEIADFKKAQTPLILHIDADTFAATEAIKGFLAKNRVATIRLNIIKTDAEASLKAFREKAKASLIEFMTGLDTKGAIDEAKVLATKIKTTSGLRLKFQTDLDPTGFNQAVNDFIAGVGKKTSINPTLVARIDLKGVNTKLRNLKKAVATSRIYLLELQTAANTSGAIKNLKALRDSAKTRKDTRLSLPIEIDKTGFTRTLRDFVGKLRKSAPKIPLVPVLDESGLKKALKELIQRAIAGELPQIPIKVNLTFTGGVQNKVADLTTKIRKAFADVVDTAKTLGALAGKGFSAALSATVGRIQVNPGTAVKLVSVIMNIKSALGTLSGPAKAAGNAIKVLGGALAGGVAVGARTFLGTIRTMGQAFTKFRNTITSSGFAIQGALTSLGIARLTSGLKGFVKSTFETSSAFGSVRLGLEAVAGSSTLAKNEFNFLESEGNRLGKRIIEIAPEFLKLAASTKGTAISMQLARDTYSATLEASTALGLGTERTKLILAAFTQIISKGRVASEELRKQLGDSLPGAFGKAAKALGVTTSKLDEMLKKGLVPADEFLTKFIPLIRDEFGGAAEQGAKLAVAQLNIFLNTVDKLRLKFAKAGFVDGLIKAFQELNKVLQDPTVVSTIESIGRFLGDLIPQAAKLAGEAILFLANNFHLVVGAISAVLALGIIGFIQGILAVFGLLGPVVLVVAGAFAVLTSAIAENLDAEVELEGQTVKVRDIVDDAFQTIIDIAKLFGVVVSDNLDIVGGNFGTLGSTTSEQANTIRDAFKSIVKFALQATRVIGTAISATFGNIGRLSGIVGSVVGTVTSDNTKSLADAFKSEDVQKLLGEIKNSVKGFSLGAAEEINNEVDKIFDQSTKRIQQKAKDRINKEINDAELNSPRIQNQLKAQNAAADAAILAEQERERSAIAAAQAAERAAKASEDATKAANKRAKVLDRLGKLERKLRKDILTSTGLDTPQVKFDTGALEAKNALEQTLADIQKIERDFQAAGGANLEETKRLQGLRVQAEKVFNQEMIRLTEERDKAIRDRQEKINDAAMAATSGLAQEQLNLAKSIEEATGVIDRSGGQIQLQIQVIDLEESGALDQFDRQFRDIKGLTEEQQTQIEMARNTIVEKFAIKRRQALVKEAERTNNGIKRGLKDFLKETADLTDEFEGVTKDVLKGMEDAWVDFIETGKFNFKDLATSIISDLNRILFKALIMRPIIAAITGEGGQGFGSNILGGGVGGQGQQGGFGGALLGGGGTSLLSGIGNFVGGFFGGGGTGGSSAPSFGSGMSNNGSLLIGNSGILGGGVNKGGIIGIDRVISMTAPASSFNGASGFQSGGIVGQNFASPSAPDSVPAFLSPGEGVFTPAQMARMAPAGSGGVTIHTNVTVNATDAESFLNRKTQDQIQVEIGSAADMAARRANIITRGRV